MLAPIDAADPMFRPDLKVEHDLARCRRHDLDPHHGRPSLAQALVFRDHRYEPSPRSTTKPDASYGAMNVSLPLPQSKMPPRPSLWTGKRGVI